MDGVVATINVTSLGLNTINVWMREDGFVFDKLVLSTDATFTPTGSGPSESPRGLTVGTPVFTPNGGSYVESVGVAISTEPAAASIYYTLDGSPPTTSSIPYSGAFTLTSSATVRAIGVLDGYASSQEASADFVVTPSSGGSGPYQQGSGPGNVVSIEAERFDVNQAAGGHSWVEVFPNGVSGSAMAATPNNGTNVNSGYVTSSPRLDFEVNFAKTGIHFVWIRGIGASGFDDSVHVGLNNSAVASADRITKFSPSPGWSGQTMDGVVATINVTSLGLNTINVWMREDGFVFDKLVLSTDATFTPTGSGPSESLKGDLPQLPIGENFSDGDISGWSITDETSIASQWTVVDGEMQQTATLGSTPITGGLDGIYHNGSFAFLEKTTGLQDYRFSADIRLLSEIGEECGLMWRYRNSENYLRLSFSFRDGFALLQAKANGAWETLAMNGRGVPTGTTTSISIETIGAIFQIDLDGQKFFSGHMAELDSGGIALYARRACAFDNVMITTPTRSPSIAISGRPGYSVEAGLEMSVAATVFNEPRDAGVDFDLNGSPCSPAVQTEPGYYSATCIAFQPGVYALSVDLKDSGISVDSDERDAVGAGGRNIATAGDSITNGSTDLYQTDNLSLGGWRIARWGYQSNLIDLVNENDPSVPHIVFNAGVPGDRVAGMRSRIGGVLEQHAAAEEVLVLIGTNDALAGTGSASYRQELQTIVNAINAAEKTPWVATVPPVFGDGAGLFADPENAQINTLVKAYNGIIQNGQLSGHQPGPDLYDFFLYQENRVYLFADTIHPNALGHMLLAHLWRNSLTGLTDLPVFASNIKVRLTAGDFPQTPLRYKQNLLESGDGLYIDSQALLVNVPPSLSGGRWIVSANGDRNRSNSDYLSFYIGATPVTLFIGYDDSAGSEPAWLQTDFVKTNEVITVSGSSDLRLYRKNSVTGTVVLGGANAEITGAQSNYAVIIVP